VVLIEIPSKTHLIGSITKYINLTYLLNKKVINVKSVTVLIPAYNEEKVIRKTVECLDSYLRSLVKIKLIPTYEVIVCINGTTDNTESIVKDISAQHREIRYIVMKDKGMGVALNEGVKAAKKDLVTFIAADGEVLNDFIGRSIKEFEKHDFISCSRYLVKKQTRGSSFLRRLLSIGYAYFIRFFFSNKFTEVGTVKVFKRIWIQRVAKKCKQKDYSWQLEILYHALKDKLRIKEIPVYIKIKRESSQSKVKIINETFSFLKTTLYFIIKLRVYQIRNLFRSH